MTNKLEAVRAALESWKVVSEDELILQFRKVAPYEIMRDFCKPGFPVTVFTDYGYIKFTLKKFNIADNKSWLDEMIDDEYLFIEANSKSLTFWHGDDEDRYDWTSDRGIDFDSIEIKETPISAEEWKEKYVNMALLWDKVHNERQDQLDLQFLKRHIRILQSLLTHIEKDVAKNDVAQFKNRLSGELERLIQNKEFHIRDQEETLARTVEAMEEKIDSNTRKNTEHDKHEEKIIQEELNKSTKSFWEKLKELWK